jgi:hypothetical protein
MKTKVILTVLVLASAIQAQQSNTQTPQQHAEMMKRGDAGMGFSHEKTTHHFPADHDIFAVRHRISPPMITVHLQHVQWHRFDAFHLPSNIGRSVCTGGPPELSQMAHTRRSPRRVRM